METDKAEDRRFWKLTIDSAKEAKRIVGETSWAFVVIGILLFPLSVWIPGAWSDGLLYIMAGSLLTKKQKPWVGILLILLGFSTAVVTFYNKFTGGPGSNIYLAVIVFFASMRAFDALRYLKEHPTELVPEEQEKLVTTIRRKMFPWLFWASFLAVIGWLILIIFGTIMLHIGMKSVDMEHRESFAFSVAESCFETARADSANKDKSDVQLHDVCTCMGEKMTDWLIKKNQKGEKIDVEKDLEAFSQKAAESCASTTVESGIPETEEVGGVVPNS